jgi:hypothetical protein
MAGVETAENTENKEEEGGKEMWRRRGETESPGFYL